MTIGAPKSGQPARFPIPHRASRVILNAVLLGSVAALLTAISSEPAKTVALACWTLLA